MLSRQREKSRWCPRGMEGQSPREHEVCDGRRQRVRLDLSPASSVQVGLQSPVPATCLLIVLTCVSHAAPLSAAMCAFWYTETVSFATARARATRRTRSSRLRPVESAESRKTCSRTGPCDTDKCTRKSNLSRPPSFYFFFLWASDIKQP